MMLFGVASHTICRLKEFKNHLAGFEAAMPFESQLKMSTDTLVASEVSISMPSPRLLKYIGIQRLQYMAENTNNAYAPWSSPYTSSPPESGLWMLLVPSVC